MLSMKMSRQVKAASHEHASLATRRDFFDCCRRKMTKQFEYRLNERTVTRRLSDANKVLTGELCLAALVHRTAPH